MLVLSRKVGERLVLTGGITITISRIVGNRVHVGIQAPPEVRVMRGECKPHGKPEGGKESAA